MQHLFRDDEEGAKYAAECLLQRGTLPVQLVDRSTGQVMATIESRELGQAFLRPFCLHMHRRLDRCRPNMGHH